MTPLPIAAFPVAAKLAGSSTFVVAVLVGLALYMAANNTQPSKPKN